MFSPVLILRALLFVLSSIAGSLKGFSGQIRANPEIRIDFTVVKGRFGPKLIDSLSRRIGVPQNQMFIGTRGDRFPHRIEELGGVRLTIE